GEETFTWRFTGKPYGYDPKVHQLHPLTKDEYRRVLDCVQADLLNALRGTGVEVTIARPATELDKITFGTETRYLRKNREVAGEIYGRVEPAADGLTVLTFTAREFWCK